MRSPSQESTDSGSTTQPYTPKDLDRQTPQPQPEQEEEAEEEEAEEEEAEDVDTTARGHIQEADKDESHEGYSSNNDNKPVPSSTSSSLASTRVRINLRAQASLWNSRFDLKKARASAEWSGSGGRVQGGIGPSFSSTRRSISNLFADLHWTPRKSKAFFRLRTSIQTSPPSGHAQGSSRRYSVQVFIFICPERIRRLSVDLQPAEMRLGANTVAFSFELSRQGVLVLPPDLPDLESILSSSRDTLRDLRSLAAQLNFVLYASIPHYHISGHRLEQLSAAVSRGEISSIRSLASTMSLYRGRGGRVVEGGGLEEAEQGIDVVAAAPAPASAALPIAPPATGSISHTGQGNGSYIFASSDGDVSETNPSDNQPPAYEEAGPSRLSREPSQNSLDQRRGKKRRRLDSSPLGDEDHDALASTGELLYINEHCETLPLSIKKPLVSILAAQQRMFTRQLVAQQQRLDEALELTKDLRARITHLTREVDTFPRYIDDTVTDMLKEGLEETREGIMRSLTRGSMRATLYFDSPDRD